MTADHRPTGDPDDPSHPDHPGHQRWLDVVRDAAIEAEYETGHREETEAEARRAIHVRLARTVAGFVIIAVGIVSLPLPGPGWLIIVFGLSLLPYAWAERTIRIIRRRIPGVPEDGRIPARTWVVMGTVVVAMSAMFMIYGDGVTNWLASLWGDPNSLLG